MRHVFVVGCVLLLLVRQHATACEKQSPYIPAAQMASRIVKRTPIAVKAHVARISGSIELLVEVESNGTPSCISVVRGHPILTSAAVLSVKDWRFQPYRSNGKLTTYSGSLILYAKDFADGHSQP